MGQALYCSVSIHFSCLVQCNSLSLSIKKPTPTKDQFFAQGDTTTEWEGSDLNPGLFGKRPTCIQVSLLT